MAILELIEEVSPEEATPAPPDVAFNSPAPTTARYLLVGSLPEESDVGGRYWSEETLEDYDIPYAAPGWRLFGPVVEALENQGHKVVIITRAEQRAEAERARDDHERAVSERARAWAARRAEIDAYERQVAELIEETAGPDAEETTYGPYYNSKSLADLPVVAELVRGELRWPSDGSPVLSAIPENCRRIAYRAPEGIVTVMEDPWSVRLSTSPCDRRQAARRTQR
jgi:hypothetical protein